VIAARKKTIELIAQLTPVRIKRVRAVISSMSPLLPVVERMNRIDALTRMPIVSMPETSDVMAEMIHIKSRLQR
jgi:hypothetical protein